MEKRTNWIIGILAAVIAIMEMTGIPSVFFVNLQIADVEPFYWTLMVNFLLVGILAWAVLHFFCPEFHLGLQEKGFGQGFRKYGGALRQP